MIDLKEKLKKNELTLGSWVTLGHPSIGEIMAAKGFQWLVIDMEHSVITLAEAQRLVQVIELSGIFPLIRVGENNPNIIKRSMDTVARGVIVPMVNNRADAEAAVASVKYPPMGTRGVGLARAQKYGFGFEKYKEWVKSNSVVIAQVEHIKAIENLEEIVTTPGIDGTIIGPYDLSGSMGYPGEFDRDEVNEAIERYDKVCNKLCKPKGSHVVQPDPVKANNLIGKGYAFLAVGLDTLYLGEKCEDILGEINKN